LKPPWCVSTHRVVAHKEDDVHVVELSAVQETCTDPNLITSAISASELAYAIAVVPIVRRVVTDPSTLQRYSVVRVLRGTLAGRIGLFTGVGGGDAYVNVVAPELKRRRRLHAVRYETGLRTADAKDQPHLDPKVGDEVWVWTEKWSGEARICSISGRSAVVRSTRFDSIASVDLGPDQPVLEVIYEPRLRLPDGSDISFDVDIDEAFAVPLHANLADVLGEFLLEAMEAREGKL
jgi:hypothetical protein